MNKIPISFIEEISFSKKGNKQILHSLEIELKYLSVEWWIFYIDVSPDRKIKKKYILVDDNHKEKAQEFDSLNQLFEQGKIGKKNLKDIWEDIELITINSSDPEEYYNYITMNNKSSF